MGDGSDGRLWLDAGLRIGPEPGRRIGRVGNSGGNGREAGR